jgi:hypothetical protein
MTGEQFRLDYIIESDIEVNESIIIKNIEGFDIIYGPSVSASTQTSFKNGKRHTIYNSTSTYYLEAGKSAGTYHLPKVEVKINNKKYKAEDYKIEVKSLEKLTENIDTFVETTVSKTTMNISDTLTLTYTLYTTTEINRIINIDFPPLRGFYAVNVTPDRQKFKEKEMNEKIYKAVNLRTLILQPEREGRVEIPEGEIILRYEIPTGTIVRNIWGQEYEETVSLDRRLKMNGAIISIQEWKAI